MMRAPILRLSPFLLLAAALVDLAVRLVHDAWPASAHHGVVWFATLTDPDGEGMGCQEAERGIVNCSDFLSDNDFYIPLEPHTYQVESFLVFDNGNLRLVLDNPITSLSQRPLTLTVNGSRFHSEDGELAGGGTALQWRNSDLSWNHGDAIKISLEQREAPSCDGSPGGADTSLNPTDLRAFGGDGVLTLAWINPDTDRGIGYLVRWRKQGTTTWLNSHGAVGEWSSERPKYTHDITGLDGAAYEAQVRIVLVTTYSGHNNGHHLPGECKRVGVRHRHNPGRDPTYPRDLVGDAAGERHRRQRFRLR